MSVSESASEIPEKAAPQRQPLHLQKPVSSTWGASRLSNSLQQMALIETGSQESVLTAHDPLVSMVHLSAPEKQNKGVGETGRPPPACTVRAVQASDAPSISQRCSGR